MKTSSIFFLMLTGLFIMSCSDSEPEVAMMPNDYRQEWVGSYEGTKSNTSLEDETFTTPISFDITIDEDSEDGLVINGVVVPISEDGTFGPDFVANGISNYEVNFLDDGSVTIKINEIFPNGIALPCYINAKKV